MLTLKLSHSGNFLQENQREGQVDPSKFRVVDFVDIEEAGKVVMIAVSEFIVRFKQALARREKDGNGWIFIGDLACKEEGHSEVSVSAREGTLCRPFTVPLTQVELLGALDSGRIQRQQMIELARRLQVGTGF